MTIPADFASEARDAFEKGDRAHLILQSLEAEGLPWEHAGKAITANYLANIPLQSGVERAILFTGHRIDSADRATPRFPLKEEPAAHRAIYGMLEREKEQGNVIGMAGGANGGDILFLEACRQLEIPFHILLALPEDEFIQKSVVAPFGNWVERFRSLVLESPPSVLAQSNVLPEWLGAKKDYNIWARGNLWMISSALAMEPQHFVLAALWDGQKGDGPGGTENMVRVAQQHGAEFIHLDTRQLFRGEDTIRSARP